LFESPHRLLKLLNEIKLEILDTRKISISREITKIYEENIRGTAEELILHFKKNKVKGEIVLLIDKTPKKKNARV
jgi:16S rRNA (cytidine1402-2'-O)-methyltransferase